MTPPRRRTAPSAPPAHGDDVATGTAARPSGAGSGLVGRPERPTRPALNREYILATALAIVDRDGVAGLSMRKLGAEMGVDPMAVYHWVPNKAALFDGLVELVWHEAALALAGADGVLAGAAGARALDAEAWPDLAVASMTALRAALRAHPRIVPVVGTRPASTPGLLGVLDHALGLLTSAGLGGLEAVRLMNCLASYTIGSVLAEVGEPVGGGDDDPTALLAGLTPETYPHLAAVFAQGFDLDPDAQFAQGLTALVEGWRVTR